MAWKFTLRVDSEQDKEEKRQILLEAIGENYSVSEKDSLSKLMEFLIWSAFLDMGVIDPVSEESIEVQIAIPTSLVELREMAGKAKSQAEELPPILENYDH